MTNIETTANASMVKPITLAISVSRFCLRSLRLYAEFIVSPVVYLVGLTITTGDSGYHKPTINHPVKRLYLSYKRAITPQL